jgi:hypothetical protein
MSENQEDTLLSIGLLWLDVKVLAKANLCFLVGLDYGKAL